jgi:ATP-binding cassette subfamily C (CFTR/MRP) protein 1
LHPNSCQYPLMNYLHFNQDSSWPKQATIEFKNVKVKYREGLPTVLNDLSFTIESQNRVGIVGRTGAGKSSITLALFR